MVRKYWLLIVAAGFALLFVCNNVRAGENLYGYFELGVHAEFNPVWSKDSVKWQGEIPASFELGGIWQFKDNQYLKFGVYHQSNWLSGPPLNDDPETVFDSGFIKWGITFGK